MPMLTDTVLDQHGRPVSAAQVTIRDSTGALVDLPGGNPRITDALGAWSADLGPGTYALVISKGASYITRSLTVCGDDPDPDTTCAGTSFSVVEIGTGAKTFAISDGLDCPVGARLIVRDASNPANYLTGLITTYSGGAVTIDVDETSGSGTFSAWTYEITTSIGFGIPACGGSFSGSVTNTTNPGDNRIATHLLQGMTGYAPGTLDPWMTMIPRAVCMRSHLRITADEWSTMADLTAAERTVSSVYELYDCDGSTIVYTSPPIEDEITSAGDHDLGGMLADPPGCDAGAFLVLTIRTTQALADRFIGTTERLCMKYSYELETGSCWPTACQICGQPVAAGMQVYLWGMPCGLDGVLSSFVYTDNLDGTCSLEWTGTATVLRCDIDTTANTYAWTLTVTGLMSTCVFTSTNQQSPNLQWRQEGPAWGAFSFTFDTVQSGPCTDQPTVYFA